MEADKELEAMVAINGILTELDEDAVSRVIIWAAARYGISFGGPTLNERAVSSVSPAGAVEDGNFQDVATIFDAANPRTEPEKVLVVGYWLQEVQGLGDIESHAVNVELKNLGHGVGNITRALDNLINRKPRLVIQTRKSGSSQQARKKYKVTLEGIKVIKAMLSGVES